MRDLLVKFNIIDSFSLHQYILFFHNDLYLIVAVCCFSFVLVVVKTKTRPAVPVSAQQMRKLWILRLLISSHGF